MAFLNREQAKEVILENVSVLSEEEITIEHAFNRVLAQDVYAVKDIPERDTSAMDGYAFCSSDISSVPDRLKLAGEILAGDRSQYTLSHKEAYYVATGAFLPERADTILKVEDALVEDGYLIIRDKPSAGSFVNPAASEIKKGEKVLSKGELLDFRKVALLAYVGVYKIKVFLRPKVAIIVTGDEIVEPYEKEGIMNTNYYLIRDLLKSCGAVVHYIGIVKDDLSLILEKIKKAAAYFDMVLTTGGVSVGRRDFVRQLESIKGIDVKITTTNIKPGRPLIFAIVDDALFFGLPGYPSAALVNAIEYVVPALRRMQGMRDFDNNYITVIAGEDFKSRKNKVYFVRVKLVFEDGNIYAYSAGSQLTSNYITSANCDAFLIIPEGKELVKKGEKALAFKF